MRKKNLNHSCAKIHKIGLCTKQFIPYICDKGLDYDYHVCPFADTYFNDREYFTHCYCNVKYLNLFENE